MSRIVTKRSGANGLWISKASFDAAICAQEALLLSSDLSLAQPVASIYGAMDVRNHGTGTPNYMGFTVALPVIVQGNTRFIVTHQIYQSVGGSVVPVSPGYNTAGLAIGQTNINSDGTYLYVEANVSSFPATYINLVIYRKKF